MNIKSILVIEDEEDLRDELIHILSFEGFNPIGVSDGEQGVYLAPAQFEALFVSTVHSKDDLDRTIEAHYSSLVAIL